MTEIIVDGHWLLIATCAALSYSSWRWLEDNPS